MSHDEINFCIAEIKIKSDEWVERDSDGVFICNKAYRSQCINKVKVDYCNNPSDIMPIAIENKITLSPCAISDSWFASCKLDVNLKFEIEFDDENPYRAIAICILNMKDAEK